MIAGIFHEGSGLGDQLFRYITVRTLAEEKLFTKWGMLGRENFKGDFFKGFFDGWLIDDFTRLIDGMSRWNEKDIRDIYGNDIRSYDPEINFVIDNTVTDGSFEDSKYWGHNLKNINEWLKVEPLEVPNNKVVIGFRGGEYAAVPELFLPKEYYLKGMSEIVNAFKGPMDYEVHTDDPALAKTFFDMNALHIIDNQQISHSKHTNMGFNWRSARCAKYAIIPNSAFFILPRLLKHFEDPTAVTIAPRWWAGHNQKIWKRPACYYPQFTYIHHGD